MSLFDYIKRNYENINLKQSSSKSWETDSHKYEIYEFEKTYDYSVEGYDTYTKESEIIEGKVTFHGEVYWDDYEDVYHYDLYTSESTGKFEPNEFTGHKGLEEKFLREYKDYLINQGVDSSNITW